MHQKKNPIHLKSKIIKVECSVYGSTTYEAQTEIIIELEDTYGQITQNAMERDKEREKMY